MESNKLAKSNTCENEFPRKLTTRNGPSCKISLYSLASAYEISHAYPLSANAKVRCRKSDTNLLEVQFLEAFALSNKKC